MSPGGRAASLTRGQLVALAVALATLVGIGVLVGVFASGWWGGSGGTYVPTTLVASGSISPQSSLFADPLTAEIDVLVNPKRVEPRTVQISPNFTPFEVRSQSESIGDHVGKAAFIRFRFQIECLVAACVPLMGTQSSSGTVTKAIVLPPTPLTARLLDGTTLDERVAWPAFTVHSRLTDQEIGFSTPRIPASFAVPPVAWRLSPDLVGALALSLAVVLLLGAGFQVASVAAGDATRLRLRRMPRLAPVERALRLAEHAAASGETEEERKALQRLAVELNRGGHGELADRARSLAWSQDDPAADRLASLAESVRSNGAR